MRTTQMVKAGQAPIQGKQYYDSLLSTAEKADNYNSQNFRLSTFRRVTFSESDRNNTPPSYNNDKDNNSIEESKAANFQANGDGPGINPSEGSNGGGSYPDKGQRSSDDEGAGNHKKESYALRAFKSTPLFIESLTELSQRVLYQVGDKKQALIEGLTTINQGLPSNVYIPFVNNSWRNYAVLNICENESKLFITKSRAPFMICLEIYRPEEILITAQNKYRAMLNP